MMLFKSSALSECCIVVGDSKTRKTGPKDASGWPRLRHSGRILAENYRLERRLSCHAF